MLLVATLVLSGCGGYSASAENSEERDWKSEAARELWKKLPARRVTNETDTRFADWPDSSLSRIANHPGRAPIAY